MLSPSATSSSWSLSTSTTLTSPSTPRRQTSKTSALLFSQTWETARIYSNPGLQPRMIAVLSCSSAQHGAGHHRMKAVCPGAVLHAEHVAESPIPCWCRDFVSTEPASLMGMGLAIKAQRPLTAMRGVRAAACQCWQICSMRRTHAALPQLAPARCGIANLHY